MSHPRQLSFVHSVLARYPEFINSQRVIEFGSRDVNGSVRPLFNAPEYVGVDAEDGPGVDVVSLCHEYTSDSQFDVVCSCEMLEHDPHFRNSMFKMMDLLRPGGLFIMTCAADGRAEHGTVRTDENVYGPDKTYYRNIRIADIAVFLDHNLAPCVCQVSDDQEDLQVWGIKRGHIESGPS